MNTNELQLALPAPESSNGDSGAEYSFASPRPQHFSLPYPIMKYILKNASPKAWKKLIQTCKYFFSKNAVFPVECLEYEDGFYKADGDSFDSTKTIAKLWIYGKIIECSIEIQRTRLSSFIPKIYKCDLRSLYIKFQNLTFDEHQFLTSSSSLEILVLNDCTISHSDGTLVTFDRLFEKLHQLKYFHWHCGENSATVFEKDTVKKSADILPRLKQLAYLHITGLTEIFDFASIIDFLMKNETIEINLGYGMHVVLSDAYKEYLEKCIVKIIETPPKRIPTIHFPGFHNSIIYNDYIMLRKCSLC